MEANIDGNSFDIFNFLPCDFWKGPGDLGTIQLLEKFLSLMELPENQHYDGESSLRPRGPPGKTSWRGTNDS